LPRLRTSARPRVRKLVLAGVALAVTASVATVAGVSTAAVTPNNTAVTPLSRGSGWLDLVYVGDQRRIKFASLNPSTNDWFTGFLNRGEVAPNTKVTGVSRFPGRLDLFAVGTDHKVYTAFLDEGQDGSGTMTWHGWFLLGGNVHGDSSVHAASVNRDTMDRCGTGTGRRPPAGRPGRTSFREVRRPGGPGPVWTDRAPSPNRRDRAQPTATESTRVAIRVADCTAMSPSGSPESPRHARSITPSTCTNAEVRSICASRWALV
jgi:hypothetical protein